ncbi:hypothetical protein FRC02_004892 [Tulasnella sp. 418]|nr:hypothetical protein FRC02_004892 [Tulasnella sp. 418]
MSQPNDIPQFTGKESPEEAEKWLSLLISSTGSFTESGIFRLIRNKFSVGSISRKWFNGLDATVIASWNDFELEFHNQWIASNDQQEWEAFTHHFLSEDLIFEGNTTIEVADERIHMWADSHQKLGDCTGREDRLLIDTTRQLLPPFIQAYLQVFVRGEPNMNRSSVVEGKIMQIAEKVDKLFRAMGQESSEIDHIPDSAVGPQPASGSHNLMRFDSTLSKSIDWESCSTFTPVYSRTGTATISESSTPVAHSVALLDDSEGPHQPSESGNTSDLTALDNNLLLRSSVSSLYLIPSEWRKPACLKTRDELLIIAQRAIDFIENYEASITVKTCQRRSLKCAIAIWERLNGSRRYLLKWPLEESGNDSVYDDLMLSASLSRSSISKRLPFSLLVAMARVHSYYAFQTDHYRTQPVQDWSGHVESDDPARNILKPDRVMVHLSGHDCYLHLNPFGVPSLAGGLLETHPGRDDIAASSAKTVMFMTISGYLAEFTGDKKHADTAILAANCIKAWMLDSATSLIKDSLVDALTAQERRGSELSCHLTGMTIEGFTVLASVTGDDGWRTL